MKTILIIDDEEYFAKTIKEALDPKKYKVITAGDGEEGLNVAAEAQPDAILLDINMPKMNGLDFLRALKNNKIPIIITSNLSSMETISEGVELGVRGYIVKSNESTEAIAEAIEGLFVVAPPKKAQ